MGAIYYVLERAASKPLERGTSRKVRALQTARDARDKLRGVIKLPRRGAADLIENMQITAARKSQVK